MFFEGFVVLIPPRAERVFDSRRLLIRSHTLMIPQQSSVDVFVSRCPQASVEHFTALAGKWQFTEEEDRLSWEAAAVYFPRSENPTKQIQAQIFLCAYKGGNWFRTAFDRALESRRQRRGHGQSEDCLMKLVRPLNTQSRERKWVRAKEIYFSWKLTKCRFELKGEKDREVVIPRVATFPIWISVS